MKEKKEPYKGPLKLVRIDHKTQIEVPANIPDAVAKASFLRRQEEYAKSPHGQKKEMKAKNDQLAHDKKDFDDELSA